MRFLSRGFGAVEEGTSFTIYHGGCCCDKWPLRISPSTMVTKNCSSHPLPKRIAVRAKGALNWWAQIILPLRNGAMSQRAKNQGSLINAPLALRVHKDLHVTVFNRPTRQTLLQRASPRVLKVSCALLLEDFRTIASLSHCMSSIVLQGVALKQGTVCVHRHRNLGQWAFVFV